MLEPDLIKQRINKRIENILHCTPSGNRKPYVCLVCDEFLKPKEVEVMSVDELESVQHILKPGTWNAVSGPVQRSYMYMGDCGDDDGSRDLDWICDLMLSPRGCYLRHAPGRLKEGFAVCSKCKMSLSKSMMPKFAIANNYAFGNPPTCLTELTEVELAMLTPVKTFGYCFSYTGGCNKQLKGSLSYFKVNMESIAQAAAHFDALKMHENIVILLYGKMTDQQKAQARRKNKVRVGKVVAALRYLIKTHKEWKKANIDMDQVREQLRRPILIDNTAAENSSDNNVETTESFKVFFPDGSMSSLHGGQDNLQKFQELVKQAKSNGADLEFQCDLFKEAVHDYKDNNLVNACLLQFPYGEGGMHELRYRGDGSMSNKIPLEDYVEHLSKVSMPHFHHDLFTLILYNISMKQSMVQSAGWKVREKGKAEMFASELTAEDVSRAIDHKQSGKLMSGSRSASQFLKAIDAVSRSVPHTNEAAKKARLDGEAHQHHFGLSHIYLTVTNDDENSFLVQAYAGVEVDDGTPVHLLSDAELRERSKLRTKLRIEHPGICAYYYELMLDILLEEVIGWDMEEDAAKNEGGLFGIPLAFTASTEEQGRTTLHTHFQIWIVGYKERRDKLYSSNYRERKAAEQYLCQYIDKLSSTELYNPSMSKYRENHSMAFPHDCTKSLSKRKLPVTVDDQQLRNLRHQKGIDETRGRFADCPHCGHYWTNEELIESYLIHGIKVPGLTCFPDGQSKRLKAMAVEYQMSAPGTPEMDSCIIDAAYNHHSHAPSSCFGKQKQRHKTQFSTNENGSNNKKCKQKNRECRYRLPKRKKRKTIMQNTEDVVRWYLWNGTFNERSIKEICIKRHGYNAFQNVSCPAISQSKMTCNTNVQEILEGPVGQYSFKYVIKPTQEDDTAEYQRVKEATEKILSKLRKDASESSIAVSRILGASFAHQKTNVIGASLASYLTRNQSRFIFSHKTVWCPLRDIKQLLTGDKVGALVDHHGKTPFYVCTALNYLCRPL